MTTHQKVMIETTTNNLERVAIQATPQAKGDEVTSPVAGHVILEKIPNSDRLKRAVKSYFLWLGIAIACVFIPMLHFILVPLFLILSIFMAINAYSDKIEIKALDLTCKSCGADVKLADKRADQYPFWIKCGGCQTEYRIEKALV